MISRVTTSLPLFFDVSEVTTRCQNHCHLLLLTQSACRNSKAVAHMLVEDQATRRLSQEVFCSTALAVLASPTTLSVYHRQRIDPHNLGFTQATLLSTIHHLRHLSCQGDRQVRCEGEQTQCTWRGRGHSLFQRRERAVHGNIRGFSSVQRRS